MVHPVAVICVALLGVMVFGLGFYVSMGRRQFRIGMGCPDDPTHPLTRRVRAHANTCEYAPMLAVLMLYLGAAKPSLPVLALMLAVTLCRVLLALGLLVSPTLARPHPLHFAGALGTYLGGLALAVAALLSAF
jgi:uncharacterized membrane protein YecN with MAPEG domain